MEENIFNSQSSDIQLITDLEKHAEQIFDWTFKGLHMQGHLTKSTAGLIKRIMIETFEKHELKLGSNNTSEEFLPSEDNKSVLDETKEEETNKEESVVHNQLEDNVISNKELIPPTKDDITTEMGDVHEEYRKILSNDLEEGEISCSTENTGEIDEDEDIVRNVNSIMNALDAQESPSIIRNHLHQHLKINTTEDASTFVDKAFEECLKDIKFSNTFVELIYIISEHYTGGQIPSALKTATWLKCIAVFGGDKKSDSSVLGFSYSEDRSDIEKAECIFKANFKETFKKDNITGLIGFLFQKGLVELHAFATFVGKLFTLATTVCNSYFRYLCSLLTAVGEQFENKLKQESNIIELITAKGMLKVSYQMLINLLLAKMQEYAQMNRELPKQFVEQINDLIHLRRKEWKTDEEDTTSNPPSSSKEHDIPHLSTVPDCSNDPGSSIMYRVEKKQSNDQKKSKTSRPRDIKRNQNKFNHPYKHSPRNINPNLRNKSRQMEEQIQKLQEIVIATQAQATATQQLFALQLNAPKESHNFHPPRYVPQRNTPNPQYNRPGQNTSGHRGRQNQNYGDDRLPSKSPPKRQNNNRRNKRLNWQRQKDSHLPKGKNISDKGPNN